MKSVKDIGRVGGLAVALGTGAWLASVPWVASADTTDASGLDLSTLDSAVSALLPAADTDTSGLDFAVSYDGVTLIQDGDATATSFAGQGDLAIAYGDGATADAGVDPLNGAPITSGDDYAFADGAGTTAISDGPSSSAIATDGATAYSGLDSTGFPAGAHDFASASGAGSLADAFGNYDVADVSGADSTATAGFADDYVAALGNDLTASATGADQFVTDPVLFGDSASAAAAVPVDDFGLSSLAGDLSSLLNLF